MKDVIANKCVLDGRNTRKATFQAPFKKIPPEGKQVHKETFPSPQYINCWWSYQIAKLSCSVLYSCLNILASPQHIWPIFMKPSHTIVKILSNWNVYQFSVCLKKRVCFPSRRYVYSSLTIAIWSIGFIWHVNTKHKPVNKPTS